MVTLSYETDLCEQIDSYFENIALAYRWIKMQGPFRIWTLSNEKGQVIDCGEGVQD